MTRCAVIDVRDNHAFVSVWVWDDENRAHLKLARNWKALEAQAEKSVWLQGGSLTLSGQYHCPPQLAAQAVFD